MAQLACVMNEMGDCSAYAWGYTPKRGAGSHACATLTELSAVLARTEVRCNLVRTQLCSVNRQCRCSYCLHVHIACTCTGLPRLVEAPGTLFCKAVTRSTRSRFSPLFILLRQFSEPSGLLFFLVHFCSLRFQALKFHNAAMP